MQTILVFNRSNNKANEDDVKKIFMLFSGMFVGGLGKVLQVFGGDLWGGVWDTFGRLLVGFECFLDSCREGS